MREAVAERKRVALRPEGAGLSRRLIHEVDAVILADDKDRISEGAQNGLEKRRRLLPIGSMEHERVTSPPKAKS